MKASKINFAKPEEKIKKFQPTGPLACSYTKAREQQQLIEIELQRQKVLVLDSSGNVVKLKLQQEH